MLWLAHDYDIELLLKENVGNYLFVVIYSCSKVVPIEIMTARNDEELPMIRSRMKKSDVPLSF